MIYVFDSQKEQLNDLQYHDYRENYLSGNKANKLVKFSKDLTSNLKFVYADKNGNELSNYYPIDHNYEGEYIAVPKEAYCINVYDVESNTLVRQEKINRNVNKEPLYKVGLISDVHYNDTDESDQNPDTIGNDDGAEYTEDLINALQVFNEYEVDFVSCCGDITTDARRHYRNYKYCVDKYGDGITIYTCTGNHDTKPKDRSKDEWMTIDNINDKYNINRADDSDGTSFYFVKYLANGKKDVYIYLNMTYGWYDDCVTDADYKNANYDTHHPRYLRQDEFVYKSSDEPVVASDFHLYDPSTLLWLANILEEYKNDRCFIFTHLMFENKAGSYHGEEDYYRYYENHYDVIKGDQGAFLEDLLNRYDNNYWFCGHSHYKWLWEKYDHTMNVTKSNNSWNIHIPSLSRPLPIEIYSYRNAPQDAEAGIMEVYDDYVVIKGMVMKNTSMLDINNLIENSNGDDGLYLTAEMFDIPEDSLTTVEQLDDNYIKIITKYDGKDIYVNTGEIDSSNYDNMIPILNVEYLFGGNSGGENFTYELFEAEHSIGFRDITTNPDEYNYYLRSNQIYTMYPQGLLFKFSSQSVYKKAEIHITLKAKIKFVHDTYTNKFLPIAQFKLK